MRILATSLAIAFYRRNTLSAIILKIMFTCVLVWFSVHVRPAYFGSANRGLGFYHVDVHMEDEMAWVNFKNGVCEFRDNAIDARELEKHMNAIFGSILNGLGRPERWHPRISSLGFLLGRVYLNLWIFYLFTNKLRVNIWIVEWMDITFLYLNYYFFGFRLRLSSKRYLWKSFA